MEGYTTNDDGRQSPQKACEEAVKSAVIIYCDSMESYATPVQDDVFQSRHEECAKEALEFFYEQAHFDANHKYEGKLKERLKKCRNKYARENRQGMDEACEEAVESAVTIYCASMESYATPVQDDVFQSRHEECAKEALEFFYEQAHFDVNHEFEGKLKVGLIRCKNEYARANRRALKKMLEERARTEAKKIEDDNLKEEKLKVENEKRVLEERVRNENKKTQREKEKRMKAELEMGIMKEREKQQEKLKDMEISILKERSKKQEEIMEKDRALMQMEIERSKAVLYGKFMDMKASYTEQLQVEGRNMLALEYKNLDQHHEAKRSVEQQEAALTTGAVGAGATLGTTVAFMAAAPPLAPVTALVGATAAALQMGAGIFTSAAAKK